MRAGNARCARSRLLASFLIRCRTIRFQAREFPCNRSPRQDDVGVAGADRSRRHADIKEVLPHSRPLRASSLRALRAVYLPEHRPAGSRGDHCRRFRWSGGPIPIVEHVRGRPGLGSRPQQQNHRTGHQAQRHKQEFSTHRHRHPEGQHDGHTCHHSRTPHSEHIHSCHRHLQGRTCFRGGMRRHSHPALSHPPPSRRSVPSSGVRLHAGALPVRPAAPPRLPAVRARTACVASATLSR